MKTLKELMEKLGSLRRDRDQLIEDRASIVTKMEDVADDHTEEGTEKYNGFKDDLEDVNGKIERKREQIENTEEQIRLQQEKENKEDPFHLEIPSGQNGEEREMSEFSLTKAFYEAASNTGLTGLEKEMHQEGVNEMSKIGRKPEGQLVIPQKLLMAKTGPVNALTSTGGTDGDKGGKTVETELMSMIDILRAKLPFVDSQDGAGDGLGATFFTDLQGDIDFPKLEEGDDPDTKGETVTADEVEPSFDNTKLTPTRLPGFTEYSRQFLMQSSLSVENFVRNHLMYKVGKAMSDNIITFMLNASGFNPITNGTDGGALDWKKIVEFETKVLDADAAELGDPRLAYLTNSRVQGELKVTPKETGEARYLMGDDGRVNNYRLLTSSLMPSDLTKGNGEDLSAMIFANWIYLFIAQWGGMEFLVNPYSKDKEGTIRINAWTFFDKMFAHGEAFSISKDITTPNYSA